MEVLKKVTEKLFGNEFQCIFHSNGITLIADNSKCFHFGLIYYPDSSFRVRENIYAVKVFDEVEAILQPLLKKYKITQGDFDKAGYGVDFISTIKKEMPIQEIPGVDASFITTWTHIDTDNEAQIRQVLTEFKKALVYLDKEFINKYNTLQQVYEGQEPMTPKERGEFLTVPGNLRKLVMEMLCNPPADLDSRFERAITAYKEAELTHPTIFKNYDKVASGLQQYFKSRQA